MFISTTATVLLLHSLIIATSSIGSGVNANDPSIKKQILSTTIGQVVQIPNTGQVADDVLMNNNTRRF